MRVAKDNVKYKDAVDITTKHTQNIRRQKTFDEIINEKQFVSLAREKSVEALETVYNIMTNVDTRDDLKLRASSIIMDRAWGRAANVNIDTNKSAILQETLTKSDKAKITEIKSKFLKLAE
jgi:hypothetical protein